MAEIAELVAGTGRGPALLLPDMLSPPQPVTAKAAMRAADPNFPKAGERNINLVLNYEIIFRQICGSDGKEHDCRSSITEDSTAIFI